MKYILGASVNILEVIRREFDQWNVCCTLFLSLRGFCSVVMPSVFSNCCPSEIRFLPLHTVWQIGALSFLIIFQKNDPQDPCERHFLVIKLPKSLYESLHLKEADKEFKIASFLKNMI